MRNMSKPDNNVGIVVDNIDKIRKIIPYYGSVSIDQTVRNDWPILSYWGWGEIGPKGKNRLGWILFMTRSNGNIRVYSLLVFKQYPAK